MVIYSQSSIQDLQNILYGLVTWKKHPLGLDHATQYVRDLRTQSDEICKKTFHKNAVYTAHKKHGDKVFQYRRNRQTQWNVIYSWDKENRIAYVNKILNSHTTISGI